LEISVTAQRRGKMVHLTVKDNGIGIPAAFRQRVFDAFVRLDPLQTKGSGIGLTITKRIVELYGGQVWIAASDQPGTTITFSLPILDDWENPSPALVPRTAHAHM
jgi:signal transduction histidine kinase